MGTNAGNSNTTGYFNVFLGKDAGYENTTGYRNAFIGSAAGYTNTTGSENVFLGYVSGRYNTTGSQNVFVGHFNGYANTTGDNNTFVGTLAGVKNTIGSFNTVLGYRAGQNVTTGSSNIIIGPNSGTAITTSDDNVLMGYNVQSGDGSSNHNVIIGGQAGGGLWTGGSNTLIGHQTSAQSLALHHATAIGADARVTVSNAVVLGNQANVGIGTSAPTARLHIRTDQANESGIRFENLTTQSPAVIQTDKFLTVTAGGDVVLARYRLQYSHAGEWADKVFSPTYSLRSLAEVSRYVGAHQHLPGLPSAREVVEQGVDMARLNATLVEKIEELTLYSIQLERASKQQQEHNKNQQAEIDELNRLVRQLAKTKQTGILKEIKNSTINQAKRPGVRQ